MISTMVGAAATGSDRAKQQTKRTGTRLQHGGHPVKQSVLCISPNNDGSDPFRALETCENAFQGGQCLGEGSDAPGAF